MLIPNIQLKTQFRFILVSLFILFSFILLVMFWIIHYSLYVNFYLIQISQIQNNIFRIQNTLHTHNTIQKQTKEMSLLIKELRQSLLIPKIVPPFDKYENQLRVEINQTHHQLNSMEENYRSINNKIVRHGAWDLSLWKIHQVLQKNLSSLTAQKKQRQQVSQIQLLLFKLQQHTNTDVKTRLTRLKQGLTELNPYIINKKEWQLFTQVYPNLFLVNQEMSQFIVTKQLQLYEINTYFRHKLNQSHKKALFLMIGLTIFIGIIFLCIHQMTKVIFFDSIERISKIIQTFSGGKGNLRQCVKMKGNNELSTLSRYFNRFLQFIANIVQQIHSIADKTKTIGIQLEKRHHKSRQSLSRMKGISKNIQENSFQLDTQVKEVHTNSKTTMQLIANSSDLIQKQTLAIRDSYEHMTELSNQIDNLSESSQKMLHRTKNLKQKTQNASKDIIQTEYIIEKIDQTSHSIQQMIQVIRDIAEKTNLLSMNSSIELFHQNQSSPDSSFLAIEIYKLTEKIHHDSQLLLNSLTEAMTQIQLSKKIIQNITQMFKEIIVDIQIVSNNFMHMNKIHLDMTQSNRHVQHNFDSLKEISTQVQQSSLKMIQKIEYINHSMIPVQTASEENRNGIKTLFSLIDQLNEAIHEISSEVHTNTHNWTQLNEVVKQFKITK